MLIRLLTTILIITSLIKTAPSAELIKETREKIAQINILFLKNDYPDNSTVTELDKLLNTLKQEKNLSKAITTNKDYENEKERLITSYKIFEKSFQDKLDVDRLKIFFRVVNNEFNSLLGNYLLGELNNSSKKKIIIFSTSMSCECTLELCYKNEAEVQKLGKENPGLFDYAVVDCFTNFDLQSKYEVGFIPVVLVLDEKNKEIKRFVREENLYSKLNEYLLGK
jgi:hypothetical protein